MPCNPRAFIQSWRTAAEAEDMPGVFGQTRHRSSGSLTTCPGILAILGPPRGIVRDILADALQGAIVANDVFVIIALPHVMNIRIRPHPFGHADFESPHDRPNRPRWRTNPADRPGNCWGGCWGEKLFAPTQFAPACFVSREEPKAHGNLRRIEQLARHRHHAIDPPGLAPGVLVGRLFCRVRPGKLFRIQFLGAFRAYPVAE